MTHKSIKLSPIHEIELEHGKIFGMLYGIWDCLEALAGENLNLPNSVEDISEFARDYFGIDIIRDPNRVDFEYLVLIKTFVIFNALAQILKKQQREEKEKVGMTYREAKDKCHVRSAIYRKSVGMRYWKNSINSLDEKVPAQDKLATDWVEYDPRDDDGRLFMFYG